MTLFNLLLALALALLLALGGALAACIALGGITGADLHQAPALAALVTAIGDQAADQRYWLGAGGVLACLLGLLLFALEVRSPRPGRDLLIQQHRLGHVSVSLVGLRHLAEHVVSEIAGIETVVSEARPTRQGLIFHCRVAVDPESSSPQLAEEIRRRLGAAILHHIGQPAARIHVHTRVGGTALSRKRVR